MLCGKIESKLGVFWVPPFFLKSENVCRSVVSNSVTPWPVASQASLSMGFFRPEYFPSPGDLLNPGTEPRYPTLQADSLLLYHFYMLYIKSPELVPFLPGSL